MSKTKRRSASIRAVKLISGPWCGLVVATRGQGTTLNINIKGARGKYDLDTGAWVSE